MAVEKMVDVEAIEETGFLDGNSSIQETRNLVVWWLNPGVPRVKILH